MTGNDVYVLMQDAISFLRPVAPGFIKPDPKLEAGEGDTIEAVVSAQQNGGRAKREVQFVIGIGGLRGNHKTLSNYDAMNPVVALFHEVCGHGGQFKYEFMKDDPLSRVLALNHYACKSSYAYYFGNALRTDVFSDGYAKQSSEIAAQYMGLKCAQAYLNVYFEDELEKDPGFVDRMLRDYVNERQMHGREHIRRSADGRKEYDNMSQIFNDFNSKFQACIDVHHTYKPVDGDPILVCRKNRADDKDGGRISMFDKSFVSRCESGVHQDIMMCAAFKHGYPDFDVFFDWPVFRHIELDLSSAFSRKSPWTVPEFEPSPMSKMKNMVEASLADGNAVTRTPSRPPDPDGPDM